jgi:hypothetical protein
LLFENGTVKIGAMKTSIVSALIATALVPALIAQDSKEPTAPSFLEVNKEYYFRLAEANRWPQFTGRVTILSVLANGWVRIEYQPRISAPGATKAPVNRPGKRQSWINLAHVVFISESQPELNE